jgi:Arc/MetJ family transcription regulator
LFEIAYRRTFVSTNRTAVNLVTREPVPGTEILDLRLSPPLLREESLELG